MFHAKDGWTFQRATLSGVTIKTPKGEEITLDCDTWCSAVASVSMKGDTREGFDEAHKLHCAGLNF